MQAIVEASSRARSCGAATDCKNLFRACRAQSTVTGSLDRRVRPRYHSSMATGKNKILVVDDDLRLRDLLQRYLGEQGFAVATVSDAAGMDKSLARERF